MASSGRKWLIGCGIGCLSVIFVIAAVIFGFYVWMNQPTELLEPERLIGGDTTGHIEWTLRLEDPGTREFAESILAASQDESAKDMEPLPPLLRSWLLGFQGRRNERKIQEFFPLVVAWTMQPGRAPGEDLQLISLSVKRLGNRLAFADWMMGLMLSRAEGADVIEHEGEKIYSFPNSRGGSITLFIRKNNIFFATDVEAAKLAVERLGKPVEAGSGTGELAEILRTGFADRPLRGAIINERGELRHLWRRLGGSDQAAAIWDDIRLLKISGGFEEKGTFAGLLELRSADPAWAKSHADGLAAALASVCEGAGLEVTTDARSQGEWVMVRFELRELPDFLKKLFGRGRIRIG